MILQNKRDREAWFREKTIASLKANEFLELEDLALVAETNCFYKIVSEVTAIKLDKGELYAKSLGYKVEGIDWDSIIGKPTTFPAEKHEHPEYVTSEVMNKGLASKAPVSHEHNLLYYGKNEIDTKLEGKLSKNDPAISANKLSTPRNISLRGNVNGSASFDGQSDISISTIVNSIDASKLTTGTISVDRLPKVALDNLVKVKNSTERLLLTKDTVQNGDTVKELDTNKLFLVVDDNKLNLEEGYQEYSASTDWSSITNKPIKFPSEEHTHTKEEITNFPIALRNPFDLSISVNGIKKESYNGSSNVDINITNEELNAYNKNEVDNKLASKSNEGHAHSSLIIRNGSNFIEYDGTSEKEINITAGGETPAEHTHSSNDIASMYKYNKGSTLGSITTSDSLNTAIAKLENGLYRKSDSSHQHSEYASINHSHGSNNVTTMTGYNKHNSGGSIDISDSLNTAIGKLEKNLDNKADKNHSHSMLIIRNGLNYIEYDGTSEKEINITAGGEAPAAHTHSSNEVISLSGYNKSSYTGAISTSDNLNRALAKLENSLDTKASSTHSHSEYANSSHTHGSNNISYMTGYSKGSNGGSINSYDSLNTAIGKLEKNLDDKASTGHSHSEYALSGHTHSGYASYNHSHSDYAYINHQHSSGSVTTMTGYSKDYYGGEISTSDSLNKAIGKLEKNLENKANTDHYHDQYAPTNHFHGTNNITRLTGYSKDSTTGYLNAYDSLNTALLKLENRIDGLTGNSSKKVTWNDIQNKPSSFSPSPHNQPSNTITSMEGYYKGYSAGAISTSDSLNTAIAKLEVRLGNKAAYDHTHSGYATSSHNHDSTYLKLSGGTITGDLTVDGTITATQVYNAVWNDYAELFEKGEDTEPGDIVCLDILSDKEQYIKADSSSKRVIGVHSDTYGHLIGGEKLENFEDNFEKFIPIGLAGRVNVKVKGKVELGDYIVPSEEKGIGRVYNKYIDDRDLIIGYLVETDNREDVRRLKMFINKK